MTNFRNASFTAVLAALCAATGAAPRVQGERYTLEPSGGSAFHKNDITYSTAVSTPHVEWARKLRGGAVRGFFIPSVTYGRDMSELMQRLELQPTTVSIDRDWDTNCWGIGDFYDHENRGDRDDFRIEYGYVERDLTGPAQFDVMVIPGLNGWSRMTRASRDAILRRVNEGAGLVLLHPFVGDVAGHPFAGDEKTGDTRLWDISPLVGCADDHVGNDGYPELNRAAISTGKWEFTGDHFITRGVPAALLPEAQIGSSFYKYRAAGDVLVKAGGFPILAVRKYGRGRVVALASVEQGFLPETADSAVASMPWDYWEYQYSLLSRAILWAAGRDTGLEISAFGPVLTSRAFGVFDGSASPQATAGGQAGSSGAVHVSLAATGPAVPAVLEITARTTFGQMLRTYRQTMAVPSGQPVTLTVPLVELMPATGAPRGRLIFDLIVRNQAGASLDWSTATFETPRKAAISEISAASDLYRSGQMLHASVRTRGDASGMRLRFTVIDDFDRVLARQERPAATEAGFDCRLADFVGKSASARAELVDTHGFIIDRAETKPILVLPAERRAREYSASIGFTSLRPYFRSVRLHQVSSASAETGMTMAEGVNNSLDVPRDSFGVYWYRRGPEDAAGIEKAIREYEQTGDYAKLPYNARKALYRRTHDKKMLVRTPSFSDPAFQATLREGVRKSAVQKARYGLDYYFVGDEGSLTSYGDAFDYSWDAATLADFRRWLAGEYGSLDALNSEWKTGYKSWDAVVPYTTEEARQTGSFAPWADHRTFMEIAFARAYQLVRDAVISGDPGGHIALSGTQATTAYNGCDWYRLDSVIDDYLSYDGGSQWDMHRSFAKPGAMLGFWTGYGSHGLAVQNAIWNAAIHNVLYPQIFWMASFVNPDFTLSKSARDMGETFGLLRSQGIGKLLLESQRLQDGIAIHHSMSSVHAAVQLLRPKSEGDESPGFDANRDGWVRAVNDLGMQFDFVASAKMESGALAGGKYRVLILPLSSALSPRETEEIEAFASRGGIVIADAATGVMDGHCAWAPNGPLNALFGISALPSDHRDIARLPGALTVTDSGRQWGLGSATYPGLSAVEAIRATTGVPLLHSPAADAAVVRQVGKGWAIYLNTTLDQYGKSRDRQASERVLLSALLRHIGVAPVVKVLDANGKPLTHAQVARYRFGDSEVVVIVTEPAGAEVIAGRDGVKVYHDANLGDVASRQVTVRLPARASVTDICTGRQFGVTDVVQTAVTVGGALVLGLSHQAGGIALTGPAAARAGDHVPFRISGPGAGKRLVRCHVFGPDGKPIPTYAKNMLLDGAPVTFVLPSALTDAPGSYTVRVTNVVTGAAAERRVALR